MTTDAADNAALAGGSYEVIRTRLLATAKALGEKTTALNARRRAEFGGQELTVIGTERVRTEHSCVPRDIVPVGPHLLLGFNVFMGLKQDRSVGDVFSLHKFVRSPEGTFDFAELPRSEAGGFLAGNLYAPSSTLAMSDTVEIFGSLFLQSLSATLPFQIHYDSQSAHITSSCL